MKQSFFMIVMLFCCLFSISAQAKNKINDDAFSSLPVLFDGRIMPIDSFSSILVKRLSSGKYQGNHNQFLLESLFSPTEALKTPIFYIKGKYILTLEENKYFLYSYNELDLAFQEQQEIISELFSKPVRSLSIEQQRLLNIYDSYILYGQILRSMTAFFALDLNNENISYFELYQNGDDFSDVKNLINETEENFSGYNEKDQQRIDSFFKIKILKKSAENNRIFKIIRLENGNYLAPWEILNNDNNPEQYAKQMQLWQKLAHAYQRANNDIFQDIADRLAESAPIQVKTEKIYNTLWLTLISTILFGVSLLLITSYCLVPKTILLNLTEFHFVSATIILSIDIALRIFISERPPIGTLYESILFAAFIVSGCLFFFRKKSAFILAGSAGCFILLLTAKAFVGEDSFSPLVAVLNTNFWLATHVIIITAGYGLCLITSLLGHLALFKPHENWVRLLTHFGVASLLFVTIGTILGGLWADQSWGRFWGWDPKENGALLIILWLVWMLHAKMTDYIDGPIYYAGMAYLSIVVALAWFGVNLLSVGLHSYGFISGIAFGLFGFCTVQTILILALLYRCKHKKLS